MAVSDDFLKLVLCPVEQSPLSRADSDLLDRLNQAIGDQRIQDRVGQPVTEPVAFGLVNASRQLLYPVVDDIPNLIVDDAIPLSQLEHA
jgi:uncharacterized protein YbaR (Trm112 family)